MLICIIQLLSKLANFQDDPSFDLMTLSSDVNYFSRQITTSSVFDSSLRFYSPPARATNNNEEKHFFQPPEHGKLCDLQT